MCLPTLLLVALPRVIAIPSSPKLPVLASFFYKGHDLPSLKTLEDSGSIYEDTAQHNRTRPAEDILRDGGMNTVRLSIWVNLDAPDGPGSGMNGLAYTIDLAGRLQGKGYKIYLDFHFADY